MTASSPHIPVLYTQVKELFTTLPEGLFIDCTLGYGGHSEAILEQCPHVKVIGIDRDLTAINFSQERLKRFGNRFEARHGRFSDVASTLFSSNIVGLLADIGVSSLQLDQKSRGFSFESETLDMRMNPHDPLSAAEVVNRYSVFELEKIFRDYGEERLAKKAAHAIVEARGRADFVSAKELADLIGRVLPKVGKIHPATRIFQAIRIEVNDELGELERLLALLPHFHHPFRAAIISFHSLEDRMVKQTFKEYAGSCICPAHVYRCECGNNHAKGEIVTKKPLEADEVECKINPRSRSAKMRAFDFWGNGE